MKQQTIPPLPLLYCFILSCVFVYWRFDAAASMPQRLLLNWRIVIIHWPLKCAHREHCHPSSELFSVLKLIKQIKIQCVKIRVWIKYVYCAKYPTASHTMQSAFPCELVMGERASRSMGSTVRYRLSHRTKNIEVFFWGNLFMNI